MNGDCRDPGPGEHADQARPHLPQVAQRPKVSYVRRAPLFSGKGTGRYAPPPPRPFRGPRYLGRKSSCEMSCVARSIIAASSLGEVRMLVTVPSCHLTRWKNDSTGHEWAMLFR